MEKCKNYLQTFWKMDEEMQYNMLLMLALEGKRPIARRCRENEISGCRSRLWVEVIRRENKREICCDSDSLLVKGMGTLVAELFEEVAETETLKATGSKVNRMLFGEKPAFFIQDREMGLRNMVRKIEKEMDEKEESKK